MKCSYLRQDDSVWGWIGKVKLGDFERRIVHAVLGNLRHGDINTSTVSIV